MLQDLVFGQGLQGVVKAMPQAKQTTDDLLGNDSFLQQCRVFIACRASAIARENMHMETGMKLPGEDEGLRRSHDICRASAAGGQTESK
jgi:hypothetical protein